MIHFSYTGQGATLCGGAVDYNADLKNGPVCNECIHVMWNEQHRRNTLLPRMRKMKLKTTPEQKEKVVQHQLKKLKTPIALPPHRGIAKKKLFLKDWSTYNA